MNGNDKHSLAELYKMHKTPPQAHPTPVLCLKPSIRPVDVQQICKYVHVCSISALHVHWPIYFESDIMPPPLFFHYLCMSERERE